MLEIPDQKRLRSNRFGDEYELEKVQILEGCRYDYSLELEPGSDLVLVPNECVSVNSHNEHLGVIGPGTYTGILPLSLSKRDAGAAVATAVLEIQSAKVGSLEHYMRMLSDIAEESASLLMGLRSPVQARFETGGRGDAETITQRFYFLKALIGGRRFQDAVQRIIGSPHIRTRRETVETDLRRGGFRIRAREQYQIATRYPRINLTTKHPLYDHPRGFRSVPRNISVFEHCDDLDTAENRFVKYALRTFQSTLDSISQALRRVGGGQASQRVVREADRLRSRLDEYLSQKFFKQISPPATLPLGSPVLQQKEGYRELFRAWVQFEMAVRLVWKSGEDVFGAGKRDIAILYEYWVFFKLVAAVAGVFKMEDMPADNRARPFIESSADGFELKLMAGKKLEYRGAFVAAGEKRLRVLFSYNRTFAGAKSSGLPGSIGEKQGEYPRGEGSWTRGMRPDYTVSLWPIELDQAEAERRERIVHLHFDAKYRIANPEKSRGRAADIVQIFAEGKDVVSDADVFGEDSDEALAAEDRLERRGVSSQRADLLKMHAYRDAIRRTEGAYIIYPGSPDREKRWSGYHELLPGIGAFPVCPGSNDDMAVVSRFLRDAAHLCVDRFSQLHRERYWRREIFASHDHYCGDRILPGETGPRNWGEKGQREDGKRTPAGNDPLEAIPPADVPVALGFVRRVAEPFCREAGIFYFHACYADGESPRIEPKIFSAKYLIPYDERGLFGWYAAVNNIEVVDARKLRQDCRRWGGVAPEQVFGRHKKAVTHYYVMRLSKSYSLLGHPSFWDVMVKRKTQEKKLAQGTPIITTWAEIWREDSA